MYLLLSVALSGNKGKILFMPGLYDIHKRILSIIANNDKVEEPYANYLKKGRQNVDSVTAGTRKTWEGCIA